jgi:MFS family permease
MMSLYLQNVAVLGAAIAGNIILIEALFRAITTPISGKLIDSTDARRIVFYGALSLLTGFILLTQISTDTTPLYIGLALAFIGTGVGMFTTPNNTMTMDSVAPREIGVASALVNLARLSGNLLGISILGTVIKLKTGGSASSALDKTLLLEAIHTSLFVSVCFLSVVAIQAFLFRENGAIHK